MTTKVMCTVGRVSLPHVLYRIYDSDDALLYVGATTNPGGRFRFHAASQRWWQVAAKITLEHFDGVDELAAAELAAIKAEDPRFNRMHTDRPWVGGPRRRNDETRVFQRADGMWTGVVELPAGPDRKRRQRRVYSKDRAEAERKFAELKEAVDMGDID